MESRIQRAAEHSGRDYSCIKLIAVSKKFPVDHLRTAYDAGLREFGENYIQEFAEKRAGLNGLGGTRYHLIGHLQSNKARMACELFDVVQTVDSVKLMQRLNAAAAERKSKLEVMIEVKLSMEESKHGADKAELPGLLSAASGCGNLILTGLMTMPPWSEDAEQSRPYFRHLAELAREYKLPQLSMGMSGDLEVAIDEGSTLVRVGTALFGRRPAPAL